MRQCTDFLNHVLTKMSSFRIFLNLLGKNDKKKKNINYFKPKTKYLHQFFLLEQFSAEVECFLYSMP